MYVFWVKSQVVVSYMFSVCLVEFDRAFFDILLVACCGMN